MLEYILPVLDIKYNDLHITIENKKLLIKDESGASDFMDLDPFKKVMFHIISRVPVIIIITETATLVYILKGKTLHFCRSLRQYLYHDDNYIYTNSTSVSAFRFSTKFLVRDKTITCQITPSIKILNRVVVYHNNNLIGKLVGHIDQDYKFIYIHTCKSNQNMLHTIEKANNQKICTISSSFRSFKEKLIWFNHKYYPEPRLYINNQSSKINLEFKTIISYKNNFCYIMGDPEDIKTFGLFEEKGLTNLSPQYLPMIIFQFWILKHNTINCQIPKRVWLSKVFPWS